MSDRKLTEMQLEMLESLVHYCGWPLDDKPLPARVMDLGGINGSSHGGCISRMADRGLCDRDGYRSISRRVNMYLPNAKTIEVLREQSEAYGPWRKDDAIQT